MPRGILVPYWLLEKINLFANRSEATQEVILRALKAGVATIVAILLAAAASGVLFPAEWSPLVVIAITVILQAVDKWLRSESETPPIVYPPDNVM
jgi:hypothetical protein